MWAPLTLSGTSGACDGCGAASGRQVLLPHVRDHRHGDVHEDRGTGWGRLGARVHARLLRQPITLTAVTGCAAGDDVVPRGPATPRTGDDVVDGEVVVAAAAVLAGPAVAGEDRTARDLAAVRVARHVDVLHQPDHGRARHLEVLGMQAVL